MDGSSIPARRKARNRMRIPGLFLFLSACVAFSQLPTATVRGVVRDSTGAVVPGTTLTAHNVETGQTRTAVSGNNGGYRFLALPVGNYEVRVEHPGFKTAIRSGLTLAVAQEAVVDFALQVGAIEQTVSVTAEAPLVNTSSGSLGGLVDEQRVAALPLDYRTAATPRGLPAFTRNNFGGSFGGPIKKDNTFFFGVFEALRERKGLTTILNVIAPSDKVDGGLVPQIAPVIKPFVARKIRVRIQCHERLDQMTWHSTIARSSIS